ncbi:hypothetical protein [Sphingorhabdus contaminans]
MLPTGGIKTGVALVDDDVWRSGGAEAVALRFGVTSGDWVGRSDGAAEVR